MNTKEFVLTRSKRLVIAFSSLGNGLVRFEFGGSLAKWNRMLYREDSKDLDTENIFDVLFVADPSQSWYQKDSRGQFFGFQEYENRIRLASRPYSEISLIGDSMGGSAALLFSHLATCSVLAFSPQINLNGDVHHVSRNDMNRSVREKFQIRLFNSVEKSMAKGVRLYIHRGVEESDVKHTDELISHLSSSGAAVRNQSISCVLTTSTGRVEVIQHTDCSHHQIAVHLKEKDRLIRELSLLTAR